MASNPFTQVQEWLENILLSIKKEVKTEHLAKDRNFYQAHFGNRVLNKLTQEEIFSVYRRELLNGNEELGEWIVNHWVFKHADLYRHFAEKLSAINPNFQEISSLNDEQAQSIIAGANEKYGAINVYLFACLNQVVFSDKTFELLYQAALKEQQLHQKQEQQKIEGETLEQMRENHLREINRMREKYEDRLAGVQRKYVTDTEALKKQIRSLQQQLQKI